MKYKLWCLSFILLIMSPFISYFFAKPLLAKADYGKRNAAYTYFDGLNYVDTAAEDSLPGEPFPVISFKNYKSFPQEFEQYLEDILPYKKSLVKLNSVINYYLFGQSSKDSVIVGNDGWLFFKDAVVSSTGKWQFQDEELQQIAENLQSTKNVLESQGKQFVLFIAPNKETIYPEYLPAYLQERTGISPAGQLINYLSANTDIRIVFPVKELLEAKKEFPDLLFYHKLDTHWNSAGAYIGASALARELGRTLPDLKTVGLKEYYFSSSDLTHILGTPIKSGTIDYALYDYGETATVLDQWDYYELIQYHNDDADGNLIVYRDSFSSALSQPLSTLYHKSIYPLRSSSFQQIFEEDADIVIFEFAERYLSEAKDMRITSIRDEVKEENGKRILTISPNVPKTDGLSLKVTLIEPDLQRSRLLLDDAPLNDRTACEIDHTQTGILWIQVISATGDVIENKGIPLGSL